jgi:hypothetical protein
VGQLVTWRNSSTGANATSYYKAVVFNPTGFLTTTARASASGETDRMFTSRQALISFLQE